MSSSACHDGRPRPKTQETEIATAVARSLSRTAWSPADRAGDPILTIDAPVVHVAIHHLTCPRNRAGEKALLRGGVRLRVAQFLANLWQGAFPWPSLRYPTCASTTSS